jgi:site-specific recombinase XerC
VTDDTAAALTSLLPFSLVPRTPSGAARTWRTWQACIDDYLQGACFERTTDRVTKGKRVNVKQARGHRGEDFASQHPNDARAILLSLGTCALEENERGALECYADLLAAYDEWASRPLADPLNPAEAVPETKGNPSGNPRVKPSLPKTMHDRDFTAALAEVPDSPAGLRDRAIYEVCRSWGLRIGEALHMRFEDYDPEAGVLTTPVEGKTGQRSLGIDAGPAMDAVAAWTTVRTRYTHRKPSEYLFCGPDGQMVVYEAVRRRWALSCKRAGVKHINLHALRHTCATQLVEQGVDILTVQAILGHAELGTTMIYLHANNDRVRDALKGR